MFEEPRTIWPCLAIALAIGLVSPPMAFADKPPKPPKPGDEPAYTIVPFSPPSVASIRSMVTDLNETGQAVGFVEIDNSPSGYRAVHYDIVTGNYTLLQDGSHAGGVNSQNQIAGGLTLEDGTDRPAFWASPTAEPFDLPLLPGHTRGWADRINDAGVVTGVSKDENWNGGGVIWRVFIDADDDVLVVGPLPVPPLPGDAEAWTVDLNELSEGSCQAAGTSNPGNGVYEAVIWTVNVDGDGLLIQPGLPASVGTLGQLDPTYSQASGINDLGDLCGLSDRMPFVAPAGQSAQALPVPRYTQEGDANDVNNFSRSKFR